MRTFLLIIGWLLVIGSVVDGLITAFVLWLINEGAADFWISVDAHLRDHMSFIYWVKDIAYFVLPHPVVDWLFDLPAMIVFPARVVLSGIIGAWVFAVARRMKS